MGKCYVRGIAKFKSVAKFHAAYLQGGGTPRRKSVGKDRLNAGRKVGRKLNRRSKAQRAAMERSKHTGMSRACVSESANLEPSECKSNRHGKEGQCSLAADLLCLPLCGGGARGRLRMGLPPPGLSRGGRNYVKVADRIILSPNRINVNPN